MERLETPRTLSAVQKAEEGVVGKSLGQRRQESVLAEGGRDCGELL